MKRLPCTAAALVRAPGLRIALATALATALASVAPSAKAQGIPVIDTANLIQAVQQVINDVTQISNQVQQIAALQTQLESINGSRNLGTVADNPQLRNYVRPDAYSAIGAVDVQGYAALGTTARSLRDARMVYNCLDLDGTARVSCQATLSRPYQSQGLLQDAMKAAAGRLAQIDALMHRINATTDQKSVLEIQARIGAENALLSHEATQLQMLQAMAEGEERIARARDRERQYEMLGRRGRIADHLR